MFRWIGVEILFGVNVLFCLLVVILGYVFYFVHESIVVGCNEDEFAFVYLYIK